LQVITKFPAAFLKTSSDTQAACMKMAVLALSATEQFTLRGAIEFIVSSNRLMFKPKQEIP
jgi:hypothetical protein